MAKFITKAQMEALEYACMFGNEKANNLLKKYAGIQARAYTAYNYYDEYDNFLANSDETDIVHTGEQSGIWCALHDILNVGPDDYCSRGEKKRKETDHATD